VANATGTPNHLIPQQTRPSAPADGPFPCLEGVGPAGKPSRAEFAWFHAVRLRVLPEGPIGWTGRELWRDWRCKWLRRFMKTGCRLLPWMRRTFAAALVAPRARLAFAAR
jgi:hypothetical protein